MSLDFLKALSVLGYLILLIKHKLNIWTPYRTSLSIMTTKTPFSSSPLISLRRESVNVASCTRTDISACGDCLADMPAELMWFSVVGFSFAGCFRGRPWPRFIVGSTGSVSSLRVSKADGGASSLFGLTFASGSPGSTSWVSSGRKYGFTEVLLKLVGLLRSCIQHVSFSTASKR